MLAVLQRRVHEPAPPNTKRRVALCFASEMPLCASYAQNALPLCSGGSGAGGLFQLLAKVAALLECLTHQVDLCLAHVRRRVLLATLLAIWLLAQVFPLSLALL